MSVMKVAGCGVRRWVLIAMAMWVAAAGAARGATVYWAGKLSDGTATGIWDTATANWTTADNGGGSYTTYSDGDDVRFQTLPSGGAANVVLNRAAQPGSMYVNSSSKFTGSGSIDLTVSGKTTTGDLDLYNCDQTTGIGVPLTVDALNVLSVYPRISTDSLTFNSMNIAHGAFLEYKPTDGLFNSKSGGGTITFSGSGQLSVSGANALQITDAISFANYSTAQSLENKVDNRTITVSGNVTLNGATWLTKGFKINGQVIPAAANAKVLTSAGQNYPTDFAGGATDNNVGYGLEIAVPSSGDWWPYDVLSGGTWNLPALTKSGGQLIVTANTATVFDGIAARGGKIRVSGKMAASKTDVDLRGQGGTRDYWGGTYTIGHHYELAASGRIMAGTVTVNGSGKVSGSGTLAANSGVGTCNVNVSGTLAPGTNGIGTLNVLGDLILGSSAVMEFDLGAPGDGDRISVTASNAAHGDLTLDGTLLVSNAGAMAAGSYTLFTYRDQLTDNGLAVTMPARWLGEINTGTPGVVALTVTPAPPKGTVISIK